MHSSSLIILINNMQGALKPPHVRCLTVKRTHLDASSTSVALMLRPCPASRVVSLPTTTTPPFIVPKAGRQRRVTAEGGHDLLIWLCLFQLRTETTHRHVSLPRGRKSSTFRRRRRRFSLTGFTGHQHGGTQAIPQDLWRTLNDAKQPPISFLKHVCRTLTYTTEYHFKHV